MGCCTIKRLLRDDSSRAEEIVGATFGGLSVALLLLGVDPQSGRARSPQLCAVQWPGGTEYTIIPSGCQTSEHYNFQHEFGKLFIASVRNQLRVSQ